MSETAINVPFEASEICHIASEELQTRLRGLSPLQGGKEYAAFSIDFELKIRLRRAGESDGDARETLAWGNAMSPNTTVLSVPAEELVTAEEISHFDSKEPNEERVSRDMPLTVETKDGKGGKIRRKVKVKGK